MTAESQVESASLTTNKSLAAITKAWGEWMVKKYNGGSLRYTESTNYSNQSSLNDYHSHEVRVVGSDIVYDPNAPSPKPGIVSSAITQFTNDTSVAQSVTYTQSLSTTQSFTWSVTEELQIGVEVSTKAGLPAVAEVTTKVSTNLKLSSTQSETKSETKTWSVLQPVICPPRTIVDASMYINTDEYDIRWTGYTFLEGYVAIWFKNKVALRGDGDLHWLWFVPIGYVIDDCVRYKIIDPSGYEQVGPDATALSCGVFGGGQGIRMNVKHVERPLAVSADQARELIRERIYDFALLEDGSPAAIAAQD